MIDTLRVRLEAKDWKEAPSGWKASHNSGTNLLLDGTEEQFSSTLYQHEETGLRIGGSAQCPRWAEISLPKLIHGSNGILLKESECDRSARLLRGLIEQSVNAPEYLEPARIDLVGQFAGDLREWNSALRRVPHNKVRRAGLEFFDSGLVWPGKYLHARLYDKGLEQSGKPSNVVRLEFQTRSGVIPQGVVSAGLKINYGTGYKSYRRFCTGFAPRTVPKVTKVVELLAWCESCDFKFEGLTPAEVYFASFSIRQQRRLRRALAEVRLRYFKIDWEKLVPSSGAAPFVDFEEAA